MFDVNVGRQNMGIGEMTHQYRSCVHTNYPHATGYITIIMQQNHTYLDHFSEDLLESGSTHHCELIAIQ